MKLYIISALDTHIITRDIKEYNNDYSHLSGNRLSTVELGRHTGSFSIDLLSTEVLVKPTNIERIERSGLHLTLLLVCGSSVTYRLNRLDESLRAFEDIVTKLRLVGK